MKFKEPQKISAFIFSWEDLFLVLISPNLSCPPLPSPPPKNRLILEIGYYQGERRLSK
jgi:hypothetical protein